MPDNKWYTPAGTTYNFHMDLLQQKHLMIAGACGSGKSVVVNGIMYNALYSAPVDAANGKQFILIDPKRVELCIYKRLPHVLRYASEPEEMIQALQYAMALTEARYKAMQRDGLRLYDGSDIYIIIDEFADLMTTQPKRVKPIIQRLAQIGRAARMHIILCTQCPLAKVIPTEIKVNFDSVLGLHTATAQHSRNIIGVKGCEELPEYGEGYYQRPGKPLVHVEIQMFDDATLQERVAWWTDQTRPSVSFLRRIWPKQEYKINLTL